MKVTNFKLLVIQLTVNNHFTAQRECILDQDSNSQIKIPDHLIENEAYGMLRLKALHSAGASSHYPEEPHVYEEIHSLRMPNNQYEEIDSMISCAKNQS